MTLYLKRVRTSAILYEKIGPQGFVAGHNMSASTRAAVRVSYVHAGIKIVHFSQLLEIHRVFGVRERPVNFMLEVLIAGRI